MYYLKILIYVNIQLNMLDFRVIVWGMRSRIEKKYCIAGKELVLVGNKDDKMQTGHMCQ